MRGTLSAALLTLAACAGAQAEPEADWRKSDSQARKLEMLTRALPSASRIMIEMGERYKNLYWAGKLGYWEFAEYQLEEMEALVELLQVTSPKHAADAEAFLEAAFEGLEEAVEQRDWEPFERGFARLRAECMACHAKHDHGFIRLPEAPKTASSPVLDLGGAD